MPAMMPETVAKIMTNTKKHADSVINAINMFYRLSCTPPRQVPSLMPLQYFYKDEYNGAYCNDGNTPTPGKRYRQLGVIGVNRELNGDQLEYIEWYHGTGSSAIYFSTEVCARDSDGKVSHTSYEIKMARCFKKGSTRISLDFHIPDRLIISNLVEMCNIIDSITSDKNSADVFQSIIGSTKLS